MLYLYLLLPAAVTVAAVAAFAGRWLDRRAARIYAEHRAMILKLRAQLAAWEREQERLAALAYWRRMGEAFNTVATGFRSMAQQFVEAFSPAVRNLTEAAAAFAEAFEQQPKSGTAPRDPRMARHGQFERRR